LRLPKLALSGSLTDRGRPTVGAARRKTHAGNAMRLAQQIIGSAAASAQRERTRFGADMFPFHLGAVSEWPAREPVQSLELGALNLGQMRSLLLPRMES